MGTAFMPKATPTPTPTVAPSKWQKALQSNAEWSKDELLDVVAAVKQVVAVLIGVVFGLIPLMGSTGIISFFVLNVAITFFYYTRFLNVDDEEFGRFPLIQEGMFPSFALFLLSWITVYNALHV